MQNLDWDIEITRGGSSITVENSDLINLRIFRADSEVSTFEIDLDNEPVLDVQRGDSINFELMNKETIDTNIFSGEILETAVTRTRSGQILTISGKDWSHLFQRRLFSGTYTATTAHNLIIAILADLVSEGYITTTGVEACATELDITFIDMTILDCLKKVSDIVNYSFFLDTDHDFKWFAKDSKSSGITYTEEDLEDYSVKTTSDFIINDIWVLGAMCFDPDDQDFYTEDPSALPDWDPITVGSTISLFDEFSYLAPVLGSYAIGCMTTGGSVNTLTFGYDATKDLTGEGYFAKFRSYVGVHATAGINITSAFIGFLAPDGSNYFLKDITGLLKINDWALVDLDIGEDSTGWTPGGSPDWSTVTEVVFTVTINTSTDDFIVYIDNMYFYEGRYRYHGTDPGSFGTWGLREADPVIDDTISSDSEAQDRAEAIIALYKDPLVMIDSITTIEGDETLKPGYTVILDLPEITTTQRMKSITHTIRNGDYFNDIALAEPRRDYNLKFKGVDQNLGILKQRKSYPGPQVVGRTSPPTSFKLGYGTVFPSPAYDGEIFYRTDQNILYKYDGADWKEIVQTTGEGTSFPASASLGDVFFRSDTGKLYRCNAGTCTIPTDWLLMVTISSSGIYADIPVAGDVVGEWYYATDTMELYRWNGSDWIKSLQKVRSVNDIADLAGLSNVATGDTCYVINAAQTFYYDGADWKPLATISHQGTTAERTTFEANASIGDVWFDTDEDKFYRWDGADWIFISSPNIAYLDGTLVNSFQGCVLLLHFDEGTGTVARDESGLGNDGILSGPSWIDGKFGKALSFDGINDYGEIADDISLNPNYITISQWIKITALPSGGKYTDTFLKKGLWSFVRIYSGGSYSLAAYIDPMGWSGVSGDSILATGIWYHIVATFDGSYLRVYLNGQLNCTPYNVVGTLPLNALSLLIGTPCVPPYPDQEYFNGIIDEVRVYNRALSAEEVKASFSLGALTVGYRIRFGSGNTLPTDGNLLEDLFYKTDENILYRWDGSDWIRVVQTTGEGTSFPTGLLGDLYFRTDLGELYRCTQVSCTIDSDWTRVTRISTTGLDADKGSGSVVGEWYYATDTLILYRWNGATWDKSLSKVNSVDDVSDLAGIADPQVGDTCYVTNAAQTFYYNGASWIPLATISHQGTTIQRTDWSDDGNASVGDIWYDIDVTAFYRWNGASWDLVASLVLSDLSGTLDNIADGSLWKKIATDYVDSGMPLSTDLAQIADALFAATDEGRGKFAGEFVTANLILAHCVGADQIVTSALVGLDIRTDNDVGDPGGPAGVKISSAGVEGFSGGDTRSFYLDAATGAGICGVDTVTLDENGITIKGQKLIFIDENDAIQGYVYGVSSNILQVLGSSGLSLNAGDGIVSIGGDSISMLSYVDFWNNDVRNFVLELRTGDPAFPATGRIWFRTDL